MMLHKQKEKNRKEVLFMKNEEIIGLTDEEFEEMEGEK